MILKWLNILLKYKQIFLFYALGILVVVLCINNIVLYNTTIKQQNMIDTLNTTVSNQSKDKEEMEEKIAAIIAENDKLKEQAKEDKAQIEKYKEEIKNNNTAKATASKLGVFKSYTDYRCLSRNSSQWKLQEDAYTDENGLRKIGDAYLVAMGSYYGTTLGTEYTVLLSNGNVFQIILCDFKKDIHTDSKNQATISDGSVLEFYVDEDVLPSSVRRMGTIGVIPFFDGGVVSITEK